MIDKVKERAVKTLSNNLGIEFELFENKNVLPPPTEEEFLLYQKLVHSTIGIFLPIHKKAMLAHRLYKRLAKCECKGFKEYFNFISIKENEKELKLALELITTNETFFFREDKHFQFLAELVTEKQLNTSITNVWSAACSTGEEAYSIAMVLDHYCKHPWKLVATDVNQSVIDHARRGIYVDSRTSFLPEPFKKTYCRKGTAEFQGHMRITPKLRDRVSFGVFNLLHEIKENDHYDVIFLRNVMIYFDDETKLNLINKIWSSLKSNGYLIVGHSESLFGISEKFNALKPSIYQKIEV